MEHRKYIPSNGTEGEGFIATWCNRCVRDEYTRTMEDDALRCPILDESFFAKHGEGPEEWRQTFMPGRYETWCSAFKPLPEVAKAYEAALANRPHIAEPRNHRFAEPPIDTKTKGTRQNEGGGEG